MPAQVSDAAAHGSWWQAFGDSKLDELQQQLREGSYDLRAAVARYDQARAAARIARSNVAPTIDAGASATRARGSANAPTSDGTIATGNDYIASLNLAWEIDLFGRLRNAASAAGDR